MTLQHIKKEQLTTAKWAGGTTTQLFISPPTATYQQFDFDFRLSYATVEVPTSTFTFMPGVTRHLMVLKGELAIDHINQYAKKIHPFEVDTFNGEWPTQAAGEVMDFNLMTKGKTRGQIEKMELYPNKHDFISIHQEKHIGVYAFNGNVSISFIDQTQHNSTQKIDEGDFLMLTDFDHINTIQLSSLDPKRNAILIVSRITG